jgi:hypothetical protein
MSLMDILKEYANKESGGYWKLKQIVTQRENQHARIIGMLAEIGQVLGYNTWIGTKEQASVIVETVGQSKSLAEYCKPKKLSVIGLLENQMDDLTNVDLVWYKDEQIKKVFEVENTTAMTEALRRVSSIPYYVEKYMVLPDERASQLLKKLKSNMFKEWFEKDKWQVLYYDALQNNEKSLLHHKKQLSDIVNSSPIPKISSSKQLGLL